LTNEKLDSFPKDICTKKILPELLKAFDFSNAGAQIIAPMFKVGYSSKLHLYIFTIIVLTKRYLSIRNINTVLDWEVTAIRRVPGENRSVSCKIV